MEYIKTRVELMEKIKENDGYWIPKENLLFTVEQEASGTEFPKALVNDRRSFNLWSHLDTVDEFILSGNDYIKDAGSVYEDFLVISNFFGIEQKEIHIPERVVEVEKIKEVEVIKEVKIKDERELGMIEAYENILLARKITLE